MSRKGEGWIPFVFLAAGLLWLSPLLGAPDGVLLWREGRYSDLLISHLPNMVWLRESIVRWRQVPLWNPLILGGAPFAADPLSGMWYPPNWLAVVLDPTLAFNLLSWLHLSWAGYGLFRLLRAQGLGWQASLLGGLVFSGTPKLVGHVGLGHVGLVSAVAWTPWGMLAARKAAVEPERWKGWAGVCGGVLGLAFLADPRWAVACVGLVAAFGAGCLWHERRERGQTPDRLADCVGITLGVAVLIGAALGLPLIEFARLTTRVDLSGAERAALSLPATHLIEALYPPLGGWPEWMTYVSVVAMALCGVALALRALGRFFWAATALFGWLLSLGNSTPLFPALSALVPVMRVPPRFLLVSAVAVCALSAGGLQRLLDAFGSNHLMPRARLVLAGFAGVVLMLAAWFGVANGEVPVGLVGAAVLAGTASAWGIWSSVRGVPREAMAVGWIVLAVLDVAWVDRSLLSLQPRSLALMERPALVGALPKGPGGSRVFSPSYSLPQQTAALARLELADGVNPLQLSDYVRFLSAAAGFAQRGYSVTLPPFPEGDPGRDWSPALDAEKLGLLAVGYVVSDYPVHADGLRESSQIGGVHVYVNLLARPRAWVESDEAQGGGWRPVDSLEWSPNQIGIAAAGPGRLVLSEVAYPGWHARVDGQAAQIEICHEILRCLALPEGIHRVEFLFRPGSVYAGLGLALVGVAAMIWLWRRA